jgi:hypothetical protein
LQPFVGTVAVQVSPDRIAVGEAIHVVVGLASQAPRPQRV